MSDFGGVFNVLNYAADPSGAIDSSVAINTANAEAAAVGGAVLMPPGNYSANASIFCTTPIDARGAVINSTASNYAFFLGADTATLAGATCYLPSVVKSGTRTGVGVWLQNLNSCEVHVPWVQNFTTGLNLVGNTTGFAYTTIHLGALWLNLRQIEFTPGTTGWVNQNTIIGGRLQSDPAGTENPSACDVRMYQGTVSNPNGNLFVGTSFEGNITAQYRVIVEGSYNRFNGCRWEAAGGNNRVRFGATATKNVIDGGYGVETITRTDTAGQSNNKIIQPWV